jgi:hypothetical protein
VLVLVVVLVLDLLVSCGEKGIRFPNNDFVQTLEGETSPFSSRSRNHESPTSGFTSVAGRIPRFAVIS